MMFPQHCRRRLPSSSTLLLLLGLIFPTPTTSFLPAPLHNPHAHNKLHRSMSSNLQDERHETSGSPSFWQRLFPSADPTPPGEKGQEFQALAARVQALEQQHQAELTILRQQLEEQQHEQEQQQQSKKEDGQGLRYSGTWTVELTGGNYVHSTWAFDLGGFSFRIVLTEKKEKDDDGMRLITGREGESAQERGEGRRPVGVYLEYLPSSNTGGGATAAVPCVQCRFELLKDKKQGEGGKEEGKEQMYESEPTFLDVAGGALGLDFTHVWDHCPPPPLPPLPLSISQQQQQQKQKQQQSKLRVGFDVSLRSVHFLGASEQAQALREAWARTEAAVEEQVRAALVKEEERKVVAEVRMREEGDWKEVVDSWLFVGGEGGEGERGESGEEERVCVERSDQKNDENDEKKKEEEDEGENEEEEEKNGEKEEVRTGGRDEDERRRRENTGGREAQGEEEEVGQADDEDGDSNEDGFEEEEDDEIDEKEKEETEVKGA